MSVNDVQWELGSAMLYISSGATVTPRWGLGSIVVKHELVATGPSGAIMNQFQKCNIGADLYNGALAI